MNVSMPTPQPYQFHLAQGPMPSSETGATVSLQHYKKGSVYHAQMRIDTAEGPLCFSVAVDERLLKHAMLLSRRYFQKIRNTAVRIALTAAKEAGMQVTPGMVKRAIASLVARLPATQPDMPALPPPPDGTAISSGRDILSWRGNRPVMLQPPANTGARDILSRRGACPVMLQPPANTGATTPSPAPVRSQMGLALEILAHMTQNSPDPRIRAHASHLRRNAMMLLAARGRNPELAFLSPKQILHTAALALRDNMTLGQALELAKQAGRTQGLNMTSGMNVGDFGMPSLTLSVDPSQAVNAVTSAINTVTAPVQNAVSAVQSTVSSLSSLPAQLAAQVKNIPSQLLSQLPNVTTDALIQAQNVVQNSIARGPSGLSALFVNATNTLDNMNAAILGLQNPASLAYAANLAAQAYGSSATPAVMATVLQQIQTYAPPSTIASYLAKIAQWRPGMPAVVPPQKPKSVAAALTPLQQGVLTIYTQAMKSAIPSDLDLWRGPGATASIWARLPVAVHGSSAKTQFDLLKAVGSVMDPMISSQLPGSWVSLANRDREAAVTQIWNAVIAPTLPANADAAWMKNGAPSILKTMRDTIRTQLKITRQTTPAAAIADVQKRVSDTYNVKPGGWLAQIQGVLAGTIQPPRGPAVASLDTVLQKAYQVLASDNAALAALLPKYGTPPGTPSLSLSQASLNVPATSLASNLLMQQATTSLTPAEGQMASAVLDASNLLQKFMANDPQAVATVAQIQEGAANNDPASISQLNALKLAQQMIQQGNVTLPQPLQIVQSLSPSGTQQNTLATLSQNAFRDMIQQFPRVPEGQHWWERAARGLAPLLVSGGLHCGDNLAPLSAPRPQGRINPDGTTTWNWKTPIGVLKQITRQQDPPFNPFSQIGSPTVGNRPWSWSWLQPLVAQQPYYTRFPGFLTPGEAAPRLNGALPTAMVLFGDARDRGITPAMMTMSVTQLNAAVDKLTTAPMTQLPMASGAQTPAWMNVPRTPAFAPLPSTYARPNARTSAVVVSGAPNLAAMEGAQYSRL